MIKLLRTTAFLLSAVATPAMAQDFLEGLAAAQAGDYETALQEWRPLAEQGNASAQLNLGLMYENGNGVMQDYAEAVNWYRLAAEQRHAQAQFNLGNRYANGEGVIQDDADAAYWYRLAAEQGHARAQLNLGVMYDNGYGVTQDDVIAHMWLNIGATNGNHLALENRREIENSMTREQIARAQALAQRCMLSSYQDCDPALR
jgi:TPR repeat protein